MRIQHNIAALNSYRQLNANNNAVAKNLEKLSSGYSINRAGDDAAGLAISEKMRAQIAGLEAAQKNANDGISLIQTAEGNLQEVHSMLNRMVELATMAANGTYEDTNRAQYQAEVDSLLEEIDRISESANFNGKKLLDGSLSEGNTVATINPNAMGKDVGILPQEWDGTGPISGAVGSQTILHKDSDKAKATTFEVSLDKISATTGGTFSIKVGDATLTATVAAGAGGGEIAGAIVGRTGFSGAVSVGKASDGQTDLVYDVKAVGNKLVFTMSNDTMEKLTKAEDFNGNFKVEQASIQSQTSGVSGTVDQATQNISTGAPINGTQYANTQFTVDENFFADGAAVKIGDETYVFAQKDTTLDALKSNSSIKLVDLTGLDAKDGNFLSAAAQALTQAAAGNKMFHVGAGTGGTIAVQEKSTYTGNADLTTMDGIKDQLKMYAPGKLVQLESMAVGTPLSLQVGDTNDSYQKMRVSIDSTSVKALGLDGLDISTEAAAGEAISRINAAIDKVSDIRAGLGALQNRLDHTINNLGVSTENITAAESRIRDTDMAKEMMEYTKNNILVQSAQAMLAQANTLPQSVLQLLQ